MPETRIIAVIPAAGVGSRMGAATPKQYLRLANGLSMLQATAGVFTAIPEIDRVIVAVSETDPYASEQELGRAEVFRTGGSSRARTVMQTLEALSGTVPADTLVLVHDAARPLVQESDIARLIAESRRARAEGRACGAVLAVPVHDTVKRIGDSGVLAEDVSRDGLYRVATPQAFCFAELLAALRQAPEATDESSAMRGAGKSVAVVECAATNIKVTTPGDLAFVNRLLKEERAMDIRIGLGYDSHRLAAGRKFILGGVEIPSELGLDGHSDADALLHAITDALLGAAARGNIGMLFPDSDPRYKGADSGKLLQSAWQMVREEGWRIGNIDCVVIAQKPRLNPHVPAMRASIAGLLGIDEGQVSVKPKTNERMGFEGRMEGVSVQASVLLSR
jgi:2-C-methyl-D-erythritol 4-phosphate cytidylyltransferase/2-C-methyl-D-erythritol 2,4-cyclodiphosphate synthase